MTLKVGPRLQIVTDDGARPFTRNVTPGAEAESAIDELLAEPFGNWHVETDSVTLQLRVTKKGDAQLHRAAAATATPAAASHDRQKQWLLDPGDPLFEVIGGNAAKRRQIDAFLRALAATLPDELPSPLRVVDLGCGNAYLTFAAYRYLAGRGGRKGCRRKRTGRSRGRGQSRRLRQRGGGDERRNAKDEISRSHPQLGPVAEVQRKAT